MKRLKAVAAVGFAALGLVLVPAGVGQINGVPASVTSIGFGGRPGPHGVPPSVTSIGPQGLVPNNNQIPLPGTCCINPLFPSNPDLATGHHHHHRPGNVGFVYAIPYAVPYSADDQSSESSADDQYNGGPTIFDRRGSGQPAPYTGRQQVSENVVPAAPASAQSGSEPAADQPQTMLVFKDGRQIEVSNYAIVGSMLYDLTPGHSRKVPLADLDLDATAQQNDSRGISFELPRAAGTN